ncbi:hypothetical protein M752DRAFT_146070 [Aspergillus phoenicis ATCC 13157]|uniref:Uncharacterized protein n=1 Tax=Aspergillus phoenicis ATCC 13157 TaxID=1353007 RepID=A0A370PNS4_ASPPH|nr:hypothetical protein M752DRAFT_146070 [Aspergillus phoenicis ATCC 13157]
MMILLYHLCGILQGEYVSSQSVCARVCVWKPSQSTQLHEVPFQFLELLLSQLILRGRPLHRINHPASFMRGCGLSHMPNTPDFIQQSSIAATVEICAVGEIFG